MFLKIFEAKKHFCQQNITFIVSLKDDTPKYGSQFFRFMTTFDWFCL